MTDLYDSIAAAIREEIRDEPDDSIVNSVVWAVLDWIAGELDVATIQYGKTVLLASPSLLAAIKERQT